ncbi:MAG TPA: phosphatase [Candidatus Atribacteria bacterium]|nr:phosphatase [Candidatus Atribacteria bacterium]
MNLNLIGDLHIHTVASGHGYSTVMEIVQVAKRKKLEVVAITDHSPKMPGGPSPIYFEARGHFPREIEGIKIYFGAEVDILDEEGSLSLEDKLLKKLDIVIISFHPQVFPPASREINTQALLRALENPAVDIIAHPGNPRYPLDYERVVKEAVSRGKVIEINNSSFAVSRKGSKENCRLIAQEVKKQGGWVVVSSDAHFCEEVGEFKEAQDLLEEVGFPPDRVLNSSRDNIEKFL